MKTEKPCSKCKVVKPLEQYHVQLAGRYGRTARCKECVNEEHRAYKERVMPLSQREARLRRQKLLSAGLKECLQCREVKSRTEFYCVNGRPRSPCKMCSLERNKDWREDNGDRRIEYSRQYHGRPDVKARKSANKIRDKMASPRFVMQITLRHGLERRPTENPATIEDLMEKFRSNEGRCAVTGIVMTWGKGKVLPTSISLDRIDPREGYSKDNIRLICHAVNAFKGQMDDAQMIDMAKAIVSNRGHQHYEAGTMGFV